MPDNSESVIILAAGTTASAAPSSASHGVALPKNVKKGAIVVRSTAGSGVMTALLRTWLWWDDGNVNPLIWYPAGSDPTGAGDSTKAGLLNSGVAISEISADVLRHAQIINVNGANRIAVEIAAALGGSSTALEVVFVVLERF